MSHIPAFPTLIRRKLATIRSNLPSGRAALQRSTNRSFAERIVVPLSSRAVNTNSASLGFIAVSVTRTASEPSAGTSIGARLLIADDGHLCINAADRKRVGVGGRRLVQELDGVGVAHRPSESRTARGSRSCWTERLALVLVMKEKTIAAVNTRQAAVSPDGLRAHQPGDCAVPHDGRVRCCSSFRSRSGRAGGQASTSRYRRRRRTVRN